MADAGEGTSGSTDRDGFGQGPANISAPLFSEDAADRPRTARKSSVAIELALSLAIITGATIVALILRPNFAAHNLAMLYLLGVVAIAMRSNWQVSVLSSFLSILAFDFFCVLPYGTLRVNEPEYGITLIGMLIVALAVSMQTARIRMQASHAAEREARTDALFRLSKRLSTQTRVFDAARTAGEVAGEYLNATVAVFLPDNGKITFRKRTSDQWAVPQKEEDIAQWVFENCRRAGRGTQVFSAASALYLPLRGAHRVEGVMGVIADSKGNVVEAELQELLEAFASQTALVIERTRSQNAAEKARATAQTEEMRSSLLSAVSHDLRTPLASITGAASTLRSQFPKLPEETRADLLDSITDEAERLSRLVGNLLDMTRLESGVQLRSDLCPLEEIVGAALQRLESKLEGRTVITKLPDALPPIQADDVLLGQVFVNLLENALKYSPAGSPIEVEAECNGGGSSLNWLTIEVRDRGAGFDPGEEERVFDKFYRGKSTGGSFKSLIRSSTQGKTASVSGAGLGLAICRAIVAAHGGTIEALNRSGGGAILRMRLPLPAHVQQPGAAFLTS